MLPLLTSFIAGLLGGVMMLLSGNGIHQFGTSIFTVFQGGTGASTFSSGKLLYGNGQNPIQTVSTTSATCSGSASCSSFTVIGSSPITISASASGGVGTSTNPFMATYFVSTSTIATSTFAYGLNLTGGCFAINGTCITSSASGNTAVVSTLGYTLQCGVKGSNLDDAINSYLWCNTTNRALADAVNGDYQTISIPITTAGTITAVYNDFYIAGVVSSTENATSSISVNGVSTTTISSTLQFSTATPRASKTNLYIPVVAGDRIYMVLQTPTFATNPTAVSAVSTIYIQATSTVSSP